MSVLIETQNLTKRFGDFTAVKDISLQVQKGEVLGFLGPNGAGKSTTMKMITGFMTPDGGSVSVAGYDVAKDPLKAKQRLGYLPEGAPAYPDMTARKFLSFVAEARRMDKALFTERLAYVVDRIALAGVMDQPIETLSKGFKRRVGLAQAILHDPDVLILDEPTDGLDPNQKFQVRSLIQEIAAEKAIVISTHILEEVEALCSRAVIINRGQVVADGTPTDLEARSQYAGAVTLQIADPAAVAVALEAVTVVSRVEISASQSDLITIFPVNSEVDLLKTISELAAQQSWQPTMIRPERGRLDDVFRDVTKGEAA